MVEFEFDVVFLILFFKGERLGWDLLIKILMFLVSCEVLGIGGRGMVIRKERK